MLDFSKSQNPAIEATDRPLHFCQLDAAGTPGLASYPIDADVMGFADTVRAAYDVLPHPEMPQGVYSRMSERLAAGIGAAGYYLCLDARGKPFWISVSAYPTSAGVIACHFHVNAPALGQLASFFAYLKERERDLMPPLSNAPPSPDAAAKNFQAVFDQKRVSEYRAIATDVMVDEVSARYAGTKRPQFNELLLLYEMNDALHVIDRLGADVAAVSERSKLIPYQLKLQAARLESGKGPIGVIASNHQELTASLLEIIKSIHDASSVEIMKVSDALAYLAQSNHAAELLAGGKTCAVRGPLDPKVVADLKEVIADCALRVKTVLNNIDESAGALILIAKRMRRVLSAMEMTRLMCKVERANIDGPAEGLENIVSHLHDVERSLYHVMIKIDDTSKAAIKLVKQMNRNAARHIA